MTTGIASRVSPVVPFPFNILSKEGAMSRFIALKPLMTSHGPVNAGDPIKGAEDWKAHIIISEVNAGHILDLAQVFKVDVTNKAALQRQAGLLEKMQKEGRVIGPSKDDPERLELRCVKPKKERKKKDDAQKQLENAVAVLTGLAVINPAVVQPEDASEGEPNVSDRDDGDEQPE